MSWDDDFLGARASRPHKTWHSFAYLLHFDQPGTAPLLPFRLADAVPADKVAACRIALKLSGASRGRCVSGAGGRRGRNRMRAGRPRSQAITPPLRGSRRSRAARRRLMRWGVEGGPSGCCARPCRDQTPRRHGLLGSRCLSCFSGHRPDRSGRPLMRLPIPGSGGTRVRRWCPRSRRNWKAHTPAAVSAPGWVHSPGRNQGRGFGS